jgi:hypothetical protein
MGRFKPVAARESGRSCRWLEGPAVERPVLEVKPPVEAVGDQ